jgi:hypothetical protein
MIMKKIDSEKINVLLGLSGLIIEIEILFIDGK